MTVKLAAIILAAGQSSRFGSPKALAPVGSKTALDCLIDTCKQVELSPIIVVVGADALKIQSTVDNKRVQFVINSAFRTGQTSSLQEGLRGLPGEVAGVAFFLVDHPLIRPETVGLLKCEFEKQPSKVIRPIFGNRGGHPTIIPQELFRNIMAAPPSQSIRGILLDPEIRVDVPVEDDGAVLGFNTKEELEVLLKKKR